MVEFRRPLSLPQNFQAMWFEVPNSNSELIRNSKNPVCHHDHVISCHQLSQKTGPRFWCHSGSILPQELKMSKLVQICSMACALRHWHVKLRCGTKLLNSRFLLLWSFLSWLLITVHSLGWFAFICIHLHSMIAFFSILIQHFAGVPTSPACLAQRCSTQRGDHRMDSGDSGDFLSKQTRNS